MSSGFFCLAAPVAMQIVRAAALGWAPIEPRETTVEPDPHLLSGSRRLNPIARESHRYVFAILAGSERLALVSRTAPPGNARPWVEDRRIPACLSGG
jgi:hypothetical protein